MLFIKESWGVSIIVLVSFSVLYTFFQIAFYHHFYKQWVRSKRLWDDILLTAIHVPFLLYIWLLTFSEALYKLVHQFPKMKDYDFLYHLIELLSALLLLWFLMRLTKGFEKRLLEVARRSSMRKSPLKINATTINATSHMLHVFFVVCFLLFLLHFLGIPLQALLAFGGFSGVIAAFGARDLLSNFFAGIMIFWDKPFLVGDWIYSPDKEIEGTVEYIGWRLTMVKTFDRRFRFIPNNLFASIVLENASRMTHRRFQEVIGIRYQDANNLKKIIAGMKKYIAQHEQIDQEQPNMVYFGKFSDSTLDIHINLYTTELRWRPSLELKQDILIDLLAILHQHKAQCAYPTRTLYMNEDK